MSVCLRGTDLNCVRTWHVNGNYKQVLLEIISFTKSSKNRMQIRLKNDIFVFISFSRAGIFKKSMGARHREGIGLSYRPARLHRLAEFIPWNRFLGSINV
jgi:hypothetical protein